MNPFRRSGKTRHRSGEWLAEPVGLCGQTRQEFEEKEPGAVALIGEVGSGKTAALDLWRLMAEGEDACVLQLQLNVLSPSDTHHLERVLLDRVLDRFGLALGDQAADHLWPHERPSTPGARRKRRKYGPDEHYRLLAEVLRLAEPPVHLLLEECQGPAELLDANDGQDFARWANRLQNLTEAVRNGGAFMVVTITRSPWDQLPRSCRDGFVALIADRLTAREIAMGEALSLTL